MILVTGGTGRLGTLVVQSLADRGEKLRVLTRDPARARHLGGVAEIVTGTFASEHRWRMPFAGPTPSSRPCKDWWAPGGRRPIRWTIGGTAS